MGIFMTIDIIIYEALKGKLYISHSVKISLFSLLWKAGPNRGKCSKVSVMDYFKSLEIRLLYRTPYKSSKNKILLFRTKCKVAEHGFISEQEIKKC